MSKQSNTEQLKEAILLRIDREVKLCKILDEEVDQEFIDRLTNEFIELLKTEIKKYE